MTPERQAALEADPYAFTPEDEAELKAAMASPLWRLSHLYTITTKSAEGGEASVARFVPNAMQRATYERLWYRNVCLKARQLGSTTGWCIAALDYALFTPNARVGIIAHTDEAAKTIMRDKIRFGYERLPAELKAGLPIVRDSASEVMFGNNASIRVSTSMRSGTIHFLIVTEMGKICARFPQRAEEIITGSLPAVPHDGLAVIESTAEGRDGAFYDICKRAEALADAGKKLTARDYRLFFFPWFEAAEYAMDPRGVLMTDEDHDYFDGLEARTGATIGIRQRAWYCATRDADFAGDDDRMKQEYPSTSEESFRASTKGAYYTQQLTAARRDKRIVESLPVVGGQPCWTFWDIGASDGTAIWVVQHVAREFRLVRFYEAWGEPYSHAVNWLVEQGLTYGEHYLPHDADHVRQGATVNKSPRQMLEELLPGHRFTTVPRIEDINWGIQQTRDAFPLLVFDETHCKAGLTHLENYRRRWSEQQQTWMDQPDKTGGHSEAADALRMFAQAYSGGLINVRGPRPKSKRAGGNWRVA